MESKMNFDDDELGLIGIQKRLKNTEWCGLLCIIDE